MSEHLHISPREAAAFEDFLRRARCVGIVTHTRPDGDAIGSSLALMHFVLSLGPDGPGCVLLLDGEAPDAVRFLFSDADRDRTRIHALDPAGTEAAAASCDLLAVLDMNRFSRAGGLEETLRRSDACKILVDHHLDPDRGQFDLAFSETAVSSTCELLFLILSQCPSVRENGLPGRCPDALLTGITTDTNNFANSVFGNTLESVSALLEAGADRDGILEHLYNEYPERRIRLMGHLLDRELIITGQGAALMVLDEATARSFGIREGETEGFVNLPLAIDRVKFSLFLRQDGDEYRVSIRSKRGWSANALATHYFSGGGHELASGGRIPLTGTLRSKEDVTALVLAHLEEYMSHEA